MAVYLSGATLAIYSESLCGRSSGELSCRFERNERRRLVADSNDASLVILRAGTDEGNKPVGNTTESANTHTERQEQTILVYEQLREYPTTLPGHQLHLTLGDHHYPHGATALPEYEQYL